MHADPSGAPNVPSGRGSRQYDVTPTTVVDPVAIVDPRLEAWQRYLDRLHERDPPGGPPRQR